MNTEVVHATLQWLLVHPGTELHMDVIFSLFELKKCHLVALEGACFFLSVADLDTFFCIYNPEI